MSKQRAVSLCGCLAALPLLIGCSSGVGSSQAYGPPPAYGRPVDQTNYSPQAYPARAAPTAFASDRVYASGPAAPVAIVVLLPGAGESMTANPELWAAQGFDVVTPPADIYRLVAGQQAALARLVASTEALTNAPVWLVGPSQAVEASIPQVGGVSGVVMTSVDSNTRSCSQSFSYFDPGTGAPPRVEVTRSGDCSGGLPDLGGRPPSTAPTVPRPNAPHIIEASAVPKNLSPAERVERLATLIKGSPSS
jgi:hypothetical protein